MSSSEAVGWIVENNFVQDRMIDDSLVHKFRSLSKILRRTKALNAKIKKYCGVKDYKHYVNLKTTVIRKLIEDTDTDNSDNFSDTDYNIIYSSLIQNKSSIDNLEGYIVTKKCKGFKRKTKAKHKERNNIENTKANVPKKKPVQAKCDANAAKSHTDWQKITQRNKNISSLSNDQTCADNDENIFQNSNNDYSKAQSIYNNQFLSLQFDSQDNTSNIIKSVNENIRDSHMDSNIEVNELKNLSPDNKISNKIKSGINKMQNHEKQNTERDKSNTKLDSPISKNLPDSLSKYQTSSSQSIGLENIEGSNNEINTFNLQNNNNNNYKLTETDNKNLMDSNNYSDTYESKKSKLLKNVRRNLIPVLEKVNSMNNNEDINKAKSREDRLSCDRLLVSTANSAWHSSPIKKTCINILKNLSPDNLLSHQKDSGFDEDSRDKFVNLEVSCDTEKQHLLPKITDSKIINAKYTIINKQNNINIEKNDNNFQEKMENIDDDVLLTLETDNEEDNANYVSSEIKKQFCQRAKLNLVASCDSSRSNNKYITIKTSEKHNDFNKDIFEDDEINYERNVNTNVSCGKEAILVLTKENKDLLHIRREIRDEADKTVSLARCTYENNNSFKSVANKNSSKQMQYCENICNNDDNQNENIENESFPSNASDVLCVDKESKNQISNIKSLLDIDNFCNKSDQNEDRMNDCANELETRCNFRHEENKQISTNRSNTHLDISYQYRPYNLQQLVEDEKLFMETTPASFTLADLSKDDEAFILNVPNKVLQCNLQGQLILKEKTIKFGNNKYRIVRGKVGSISCIFATNKQRKPYKIVNIKKISTITVQERLPHCLRKSNISSFNDVIFSESESSKINNRQADETNSEILKIYCDKRKRKSLDFETDEQSPIKKGRLKMILKN